MATLKSFGFSDEDFASMVGSSVNFDNINPNTIDKSEDFVKLLALKKKSIRIELHGKYILDYLKAGVIPQGLQIKNIPGLFIQVKHFLERWSLIANRCSRDLMMLIVETAKEVLAELIQEILELENQIKSSTVITDIKKKLEEVESELNSYSEYLIKRKMDKLQKDIRYFSRENVYPYLRDNFYEQTDQFGQEMGDSHFDPRQKKVTTFSNTSDSGSSSRFVVAEVRRAGRSASEAKRQEVLDLWLVDYPDFEAAKILSWGFKIGFRIGYQGPRVGRWSDNLKSAKESPHVVRKKLDAELAAGRIAGPFVHCPLPDLIVSPLGVVPKKAEGEFRLIHHLSWPEGSSINDFIDPADSTVTYASVDDALRLVRTAGVGALLAKSDIQSAFRLLPIHPWDFSLLGMHFDGSFYVDRVLPMGCSVSCSLFETFSTFLQWRFTFVSGHALVCHYLDDFLFIGEGCSGQCQSALNIFQALAEELGVPLAPDKTEGPCTSLTFLGIEIDTLSMVARLPVAKVKEMSAFIHLVLGERKVVLKTVQKLLGYLNFACRVVRAGRTFCRRLGLSMSGASLPHHRVRITTAVRADLTVWLRFLQDFNGVSLFFADEDMVWQVQLFTDASGAHGFGIFWEGRWCAAGWPAHWKDQGRSIAFLELFPLLVALHLWGDEFQNRSVLFHVDNLAVVHLVNHQKARDLRVLRLLRAFMLRCLQLNIVFKARHVPGTSNCIADSLSRFQWSEFRKLAPGADLAPTPIPQSLAISRRMQKKGVDTGALFY
ncbi:uncharacterized protein LOC144762432 [Lissotriton helveticus]